MILAFVAKLERINEGARWREYKNTYIVGDLDD
jgi:hypothetical protein